MVKEKLNYSLSFLTYVAIISVLIAIVFQLFTYSSNNKNNSSDINYLSDSLISEKVNDLEEDIMVLENINYNIQNYDLEKTKLKSKFIEENYDNIYFHLNKSQDLDIYLNHYKENLSSLHEYNYFLLANDIELIHFKYANLNNKVRLVNHLKYKYELAKEIESKLLYKHHSLLSLLWK